MAAAISRRTGDAYAWLSMALRYLAADVQNCPETSTCIIFEANSSISSCVSTSILLAMNSYVASPSGSAARARCCSVAGRMPHFCPWDARYNCCRSVPIKRKESGSGGLSRVPCLYDSTKNIWCRLRLKSRLFEKQMESTDISRYKKSRFRSETA